MELEGYPVTIRVALYARYSTDKQDKTSIEDQLRQMKALCDKNGWQIVETYHDAAKSSRTLHNRPGLHRLMADMRHKRFNMIMVEKTDRLSRKLGDSGKLFEEMTFLDVTLFSLRDGRIDQMKLGIGALIGEAALEEIRVRTHRGLEGRVLRGTSGGGKSYGYRPVRAWNADGTPVTGELEIVPEQSDVVKRILVSYADGMSPQQIADQLNKENIPGPRGGFWNYTTIYGNPKRGTGILNNELYIGMRVWDRLNYRLNPATGARNSRSNPDEQLKRVPVPHLRIIDQELWERVKARQEERSISEEDKKAWQAREERYLLTGLVTCGCCGGNYCGQGRGRMRCATSVGKGKSVCANRMGIDAAQVADMVLAALADCLMEETLVRQFAAEYLAERERLASSAPDARRTLEKERAQNLGKQDNLIDALAQGIAPERVKSSLQKLADELFEIDARLAAVNDAEREPAIHPGMAADWRAQIREMIMSLSQEGSNGPTMEAVRKLIDRVTVTPVDSGKKRPLPHIYLRGDICGILGLTLGLDGLPEARKTSVYLEVRESRVFLVAGAGFGLTRTAPTDTSYGRKPLN